MTVLTLRLDWSEMDLFGHINNVSFFKFIQAARVNLWEVCGIPGTLKESSTGPMVASCTCDFKKPLFFPGQIRIETRVIHIGTTSYQTEHHIFNDRNEMVAIGRDVLVYFDFDAGTKTPIPEKLKVALEGHSG